MKSKIILIIAIAGIAVSCSSSVLTYKTISYTAKGYSEAEFKNIAVLADFDQPFIVSQYERIFMKTAYKEGIECRKATPLIPPVKSYTDDEIFEKMQEEGIEALAVLTFVKQYYIRSENQNFENNEKINKTEANENIRGDEEFVKISDKVFIKCRVFDVKNREIAWISTMGNDNRALLYKNLDSYSRIEWIALKFLLQMKSDGILVSSHPRRK